jgi:hypothetical protein
VQINQRDTDTIIHADQKNTGAAINLNKLEIDFESPPTKSKNNSRSEIGSEIENILNSNSDAGKLNKESHLMPRLYTAIFI